MLSVLVKAICCKAKRSWFSLRTGRLIWFTGVLCMLTSACSMTGFGSTTLQEPQTPTIGGTVGIWMIEGEFEKPSSHKDGRSVDYAINVRMPLKAGEGALRWKAGSQIFTPYVIGGWGKMGGATAWNAGAGGILGKDESREFVPHILVWPSLRCDYRHFFISDNEHVDRIYLGLEFLFSTIG